METLRADGSARPPAAPDLKPGDVGDDHPGRLFRSGGSSALSDFRLPDTLRTGVASLYTGFADVWRAVDIPTELTTTGARNRPAHHARNVIT